jgi:hypothetical protein
LAVARVDAGMPIGSVDSRIVAFVDRHNPG